MSVESILKKLKDLGYRSSEPRKVVVEILHDHMNTFLTADELYIIAKNKYNKINRSTVYRNIEILYEEKLIHKSIKNDGTTRIKLLCSETHHHHMICDGCGKIIIYPKCDLHIYEAFAKSNGFKLTGHILELHGLCEKCQV